MPKSGSTVIGKIRKVFLWIIVVFLTCELFLFIITPIYDFPQPSIFAGDKLYNPYRGMDSSQWKKANFHFHTRAWAGLTNGRKNSDETFWKTYKKLGYDVPCISNYQNISKFNKDSAFYIPVYEHGFGIQKKHQLCIGARKVSWIDFSIFQNLNTRQFMLNILHDQNEAVALAHPDWEDGYPVDLLHFLSNYDLIEVLDQNWRSIPQWDAALSSGHPVFIVADDDAHDVYNIYKVGICCTFINSRTNHTADILHSLKEGNAFGADVYMYNGEGFDKKAERAKQIPKLNSVKLDHDTLWISVSSKPMKVEFIGQDGKIMKTVEDHPEAFYKFLPEDTYIRTVITFPNDMKGRGTRFYLNPVFRYSGERPVNSLRAEVNRTKTWLIRLVSIPVLLLLFGFFVYLQTRRKH
ncbi:MAG: hypothetical protein NTX61_02250 [Bacteroidetes bacterium]|nr:hypothetical protein [Bacteroidota bacterium]